MVVWVDLWSPRVRREPTDFRARTRKPFHLGSERLEEVVGRCCGCVVCGYCSLLRSALAVLADDSSAGGGNLAAVQGEILALRQVSRAALASLDAETILRESARLGTAVVATTIKLRVKLTMAKLQSRMHPGRIPELSTGIFRAMFRSGKV